MSSMPASAGCLPSLTGVCSPCAACPPLQVVPLPAPTRALQGATDKVQHSASGRGGDPIKTIAARRFAELDREGKGRVSFLQVRRGGLAYFGTRLFGVLSCRGKAMAGAAL